jgi:hypothetical protein
MIFQGSYRVKAKFFKDFLKVISRAFLGPKKKLKINF